MLAIDLPVGYDKKATQEWLSGQPTPVKLRKEDFEVLVDGRPQRVISVAAPTPEEEPWRLVVWLDLSAVDPVDVRWATTLLAERADDLVALGTVEAMIVDETPRSLFPPTRDADALRDAISQLSLFPEGRNELLGLRSALVDEIGEGEAEPELIEAFIAEETRLVLRRQNLLLTWLTAEGFQPGGRRALMLVDGGFDFDPEAFYRPFLSTVPAEKADSPRPDTTHPLRLATEDLARILAAYGWVTLPTLPPEPILLVEGLRIGKWLFYPVFPHGERPTDEEIDRAAANESTERAGLSRLGRIVLPGLKGKRQEHRDPELAEAYLELGTVFQKENQLDEAQEALEKSLYHFAEDPRTAPRQAVAMVHLAAVLEGQNKKVAARQALSNARRLDPEILAEGEIVVAFLAKTEPLRRLAWATSGHLVRREEDVDAALTDLEERLRVTYQLDTAPDGQLTRLDLRFKGSKERLRFPSWGRNGTPEAVSVARLHRLLWEEGGETFLPLLPSGEDVLRAELVLDPEVPTRGEMKLHLQLPRALTDAPPLVPRISLAFAKVDGSISLEHRASTAERSEGDIWQETLEVILPTDTARLAVVVEDLFSGTWGGDWVDF